MNSQNLEKRSPGENVSEMGVVSFKSHEELRADALRLDAEKKSLEETRNKPIQEGLTSQDFDYTSFAQDKNVEKAKNTVRETSIDMIKATPGGIQTVSKNIDVMSSLRSNSEESSLSLVDNPKALAVVSKQRKIEAEILDGSFDFVVYKKEDHEKIGQEYIDSIVKSNASDNADMSYPEMAMGVDYGSLSGKVTSENQEIVSEKIDKDVEAAKKAVALQIEETFAKQEASRKLEKFKKIAAEYTANDDILRPVNDVAPIKELVEDLSKTEMVAPLAVEKVTEKKEEAVTSPEKEMEDSGLMIEKLNKNLDTAHENLKRCHEIIEKQKSESKENLKALGLTNIEKGLAAWKKVRPGYKMALGLALGASGLGAVSIGLSALTFTEKGYSEKRESLAKEGKEEDKYWTLMKSAGIGILLAVGTSHLSQLAGTAISEHAPGVMDSIKGFFGSASTPPVVDHFESSVVNGLDGVSSIPEAVAVAPVSPDTVILNPEAVSDMIATNENLVEGVVDQEGDFTPEGEGSLNLASTDTLTAPESPVERMNRLDALYMLVDNTSPINFEAPSYTMAPGDTTDSILHRVLNSVDELKVLPEEDKLKFISDMKEQWSTPISGASTPNWALKEMAEGMNGTEIHHLDNVRDAFVTLGERANIINDYGSAGFSHDSSFLHASDGSIVTSGDGSPIHTAFTESVQETPIQPESSTVEKVVKAPFQQPILSQADTDLLDQIDKLRESQSLNGNSANSTMNITPEASQLTTVEPSVSSSFIPDANNSIIDLDKPYTISEGDTKDIILEKVLDTINESKNMTPEQKTGILEAFKVQTSSWFTGVSNPNFDLDQIQPGTKLTNLHHVAAMMQRIVDSSR